VPLRDVDWAYAAGIIDGDGCIRFNRQPSGGLVIRVHVTNTNPILTDWLKQTFGGYVWMESKQYAPNRKIRYVWELSAKKAIPFLEGIRPHLRLKTRQCDLVLAIQRTKRHGRRMTAFDRFSEEASYQTLKLLNKKGIA